MNLRFGIKLGIAIFVMSIFFIVKTAVLLETISSTSITRGTEYSCFLLFSIIFWFLIKEYTEKNKKSIQLGKYAKKLNENLIRQSHNTLFYEGNVNEGAKILTKEVTESINTDRCSVWLYNKEKTSIVCQQLYIKAEDSWYQDIELHEKDFKPYFDSLKKNPIIVANDASKHEATSCFTETYLKPLGVKSMLDVPVIYKGEMIGVICIESLTLREWNNVEVNFAQMLSSLYSFAYSIKDGEILTKKIKDIENFINTAALVSITDKNGKIIYANEKFTKVSGYSLEEILGKDHSIVNSGQQSKDYWVNMYKTVLKGEVWNDVVVNKAKDGSLYYVDTYIRAIFDEKNKLEGFASIRQDVTDIVESGKEIEKKNTYLEHAAKILRHDMHSGINTYMPRGLSSLERRLNEDQIKDLKIEAPLKMIKEGLRHSQKVYKGVYEFTNLVKKDTVLNREVLDLKKILDDYLSATAYTQQVDIENLGIFSVNEALFCTAIDNLIRNGLKYNDSDNKKVKIYRDEDFIYVEDNGRGMSAKDFANLSKPYVRKEGQKENGTGLGLNICIAILEEHGFSVYCDKMDKGGTQLKIKLK